MNAATLVQIAIDLFLGAGLFVCAARLARPPKDDPRLSRGLQLLQSKIAILEDQSDRAEALAQSLAQLLDQKGREVQARVEEAERHVQAVKSSIDRSLEVARIFEDKIPHQEIIERRQTAKYVQAARLAHHGLSAAEIAERVDLSAGEIEFIAKVNKDRLMFSEANLPAWADEPLSDGPVDEAAASFGRLQRPEEPEFVAAPVAPATTPGLTFVADDSAAHSLAELGARFRQATVPSEASASTESIADSAANEDPNFEANDGANAAPVATSVGARATAGDFAPAPATEASARSERASVAGPVVRKVEFPRVTVARATDNLS